MSRSRKVEVDLAMILNAEDTRVQKILLQHGVVAFPTDTVYGIGCDPLCSVALQKIKEIKRRKENKGFLVLIDHPDQVLHYAVHVPKYAEKLMAEYWPGSVTLIFEARKDLPEELSGDSQTIGIRLSAHPTARHLASLLPHGITSTSANLTGCEPLCTTDEVKKEFGESVEEVVSGDCGCGIPSTVVDCTGFKPFISRVGAVDVVGITDPVLGLQGIQ